MATTIDYTNEDVVSTLFATSYTDELHKYLGLDPAVSAANQPVDVDELLHDALHIIEGDQFRNILQKPVTLELPYSAFTARDNKVYLPYGSVSSVTSFTWTESDDTTSTLVEGTDYTLYGNEPAFLWAENWFSVMSDLNTSNPEVVTIVYTTGYSAFAEIPRGTLSAIKVLCYYLFNNRGLDDIPLPVAYKHQVSQAMANNRRALEYV